MRLCLQEKGQVEHTSQALPQHIMWGTLRSRRCSIAPAGSSALRCLPVHAKAPAYSAQQHLTLLPSRQRKTFSAFTALFQPNWEDTC